MKKLIFTALIMSILSGMNFVFAEETEQADFIDNFRNCVVSKYTDYNGIKDIKGWRAGKCVYEEKNSYGQTTRCYFSNDEIYEIANTMRIYSRRNSSITLKYTNGTEESFDTASASIMDWMKYINLPGACFISR